MPESNRYDVLIVGAGQAGIPLAHDLARAGRRVALAEEKHLGGSCVNFGCTPTKAVIASARVAHLARRGKEFGLKIPIVEVDFPAVLERARRILMESRNDLQKDFEKTDNPRSG
jgi:pyruvate/2-oxoglutarate dehydrogenase complex dihydrolipoamide dehydrogenase (E3) component